jgi:hypothetical protein
MGSLNSFKVVDGLGKGSFGAVFLVEHDFPSHHKLSASKKSSETTTTGGAAEAAEAGGGEEKKQRRVLAMKMVARETVSSSEKRVRHLEVHV